MYYPFLIFIFTTGTALGTLVGRLYGMLFWDAFFLFGVLGGCFFTGAGILILLAPLDDLEELQVRRRKPANTGRMIVKGE
ncbi:MAG: hypothetical protein WCH43_11565 [Verrucomicrobiota bacterium]